MNFSRSRTMTLKNRLMALTAAAVVIGELQASADAMNFTNGMNTGFESKKPYEQWQFSGELVPELVKGNPPETAQGETAVRIKSPAAQKTALYATLVPRISIPAEFSQVCLNFSAKGNGIQTAGFWIYPKNGKKQLKTKMVSLTPNWEKYSLVFELADDVESIQVVFVIPPAARLSKKYPVYKNYMLELDDVSVRATAGKQKTSSNAKISKIVIYHAPDAPPSVKEAAEEIRKFVKDCHGEYLKIVTVPESPMICLGENTASKKAGITAENLPFDGFRIRKKGNDLFIVGHDIPKDGLTAAYGHSFGTLYGTYTWLEKALGVAFLMPGEQGTYIPDRKNLSFALEKIDLTDSPVFFCRYLGDLGFSPEAKKWFVRNKIGRRDVPAASSFSFMYNHCWQEYYPIRGEQFDVGDYETADKVFSKHPEYFAMNSEGKRISPVDQGKFCLTSPGFISETARRVEKYLEKHPSASLSPNDGGNFCQCSECKKFYVKTGPMSFQPNTKSVTGAVLHYYENVARIVKKKYPDKTVGGFVYLSYIYPPAEKISLPNNLWLTLAPDQTYGWTQFKPGFMQKWTDLVKSWSRFTPNIAYYGADTWIRDYSGLPLPTGGEMMNRIFNTLRKAGYHAIARYYGNSSLGTGMVHNYLAAKMMWNPEFDWRQAETDFFAKAYGPAAGKAVHKIYDIALEAMQEYISHHSSVAHNMTLGHVACYSKRWTEIESLYIQAAKQPKNQGEQWRFEKFSDNMKIAYYSLTHFGLIKSNPKSPLYLDDMAFVSFSREKRGFGGRGSIAKAYTTPVRTTPEPHRSRALKNLKVWKNTVPAILVQPVQQYQFWLAQEFVLCPDKDTEANIRITQTVNFKAIVPDMQFYSIYNSRKELIHFGICNASSIRFPVKKGEHYFLTYNPLGYFQPFRIDCNIPYAAGDSIDPNGMLFRAKTTPVYFYVPENLAKFKFYVTSNTPSSVEFYAPDGKLEKKWNGKYEIFTFPGKPGFWKICSSCKGTLYLRQDAKLSGLFSLEPDKAVAGIRIIK